MGELVFKIAQESDEFEQIHRLNYLTFVEEIPQHSPNPQGRLVDKFHHENTYFIALADRRVVGMICARDKRPLSLDQKLENLDSYLPQHRALCEFRLLAVEKEYRAPRVFQGLLRSMAEYSMAKGYDLAIMTGTTRQLRLYKHLGFEPFGPLVGTDDARFQPMYITLSAYHELRARSRLLDN